MNLSNGAEKHVWRLLRHHRALNIDLNRLKTKATLEVMKKIHNRVQKEMYFQNLIHHCNHSLATAYMEKQQKEIHYLKGEVSERDLKIVEMQKVLILTRWGSRCLAGAAHRLGTIINSGKRTNAEPAEALDAQPCSAPA